MTAPTLRGRVESLRGTLAAGATAVLAITVLGAAAKFGAQALFARLVGLADYGRYAFALGWVQLLAPLATLGYGAGVLAFAPRYRVTRDWPALAAISAEATRTSLWFGTAIGAGGAAIAVAVGADRSLPTGLLAIPLFALMLVQQELLRSHGRTVTSFGLTLLAQPMLAVALVGVFELTVEDLTATHVVVATLVSLLTVVLVQRLVLRSLTRGTRGATRPERDPRWRQTSLWLLASAAASRVMQQADIVLVGMLLGPVEAGLYAAASRFSEIATFAHAAVTSVVAPTISAEHALGDRDALQRTVSLGVRLSLWPSILAAAALVAGGERALRLFGAGFGDARWALALLALSGLANAATGPCGHLLGLTGHERPFARLSWACAVVGVVATLILVPIAGINGAAVARMLTFGAMNVLGARMALRRTGIRSFPALAREPTPEAPRP